LKSTEKRNKHKKEKERNKSKLNEKRKKTAVLVKVERGNFAKREK